MTLPEVQSASGLEEQVAAALAAFIEKRLREGTDPCREAFIRTREAVRRLFTETDNSRVQGLQQRPQQRQAAQPRDRRLSREMANASRTRRPEMGPPGTARTGSGPPRRRFLPRLNSVVPFLSVVLLGSMPSAQPQEALKDPLFDFEAILGDSLHAKAVRQPDEGNGVIVERIEFTSQMFEGKPIRVTGYLAYPKGAKARPAVFFSMPGMAPANVYWPSVFAKKGYVGLAITLPTGKLPPVPAVDGQVLSDGNLTNFAIAQMRAITYLTQRPEVDRGRIGIGGSSYGGFFATLIAGADPRVKAGMSFFAGGRHDLGTNLPQFAALGSLKNAQLWMKTVDPAWRLSKRKVPFLWGVAANDHWFHFPALVKTYEESIGNKRMGILVHWAHAFDDNMDNQLLDWFDTQLARPEDNGSPRARPPYNRAGELTVGAEIGKQAGLAGSWNWTGSNRIVKAELIVSYGVATPWYGWVYRYHHPISARITGSSAWAEVPVPEVKTPILLYGNITDENGVLISTSPKTVVPAEIGVTEPTGQPRLNCYPLGDFSEEDWTHLVRTGIQFGKPDETVKHSGTQSIRLGPKAVARMKLLHVPEHGHRLSLWLRAEKPAKLSIEVASGPPFSWDRPVVAQLRAELEKSPLPTPAKDDLPKFFIEAHVGPNWKKFSLDCPFKGIPIEGHDLAIRQTGDAQAIWWVDTVKFEPVWRK